jgi:peroxiredoxin Q/BCP
MKDFKKKGYGVAGLSKDNPQSHAKFADKLSLTYPLLADVEKRLMTDLGAWGEKKLYGKVSQGAFRSTFISDAKGKLLRVYPKVKAKGHAEQVLNELG